MRSLVSQAREVYTVAEVAGLTGLSRTTITRLFERERGVLIIERPETVHKRRYRASAYPAPSMSA